MYMTPPGFARNGHLIMGHSFLQSKILLVWGEKGEEGGGGGGGKGIKHLYL